MNAEALIERLPHACHLFSLRDGVGGYKGGADGICALSVPKTRETALRAYQEKLSSLKFLDPACGSGNFLTETYVSLRRLENRVLSELHHGQVAFADESISPIKVSIHQFYGIEINDFAVTVAKTACGSPRARCSRRPRMWC